MWEAEADWPPVRRLRAVAAIEAEGLVKVYRSRKSEVRALDGVDLEVQEGTVLGLLGPNGAGKTTTVRILTTLLRPDAGSARVAGLDVVRDAQAVRRLIGLSGQYAAVDENLTGRENLWMFGRLYQLASGEARRRADELLDRFALADAADRVAKTYSGGMRRRLDLASALIGRPQLLFLDEPTTGLDPRSRLGMWDVIRDPGARGRDAAADDAVPRGGGRARGRDRRRRPRPDHRARHRGRAEVAGRRRADRGRRARPRRARARRNAPRARRHRLGRRAHPPPHDRRERRRRTARRRRPPPRRRARSRSTTSACAGRRSTTSSSRSRGTSPRSCPPKTTRRKSRHERALGGRQRRPGHDLAQPEARAADPGARDLRDPAVDHVRGAVRVRLRRRDPASGRRLLPRVPDARHLHPDARLRLDHDGDRGHRRHGERADRPLPLAADGPLGRPQRAHDLRRRLQRRHPRRADAVRPRRRLARARNRRRVLPRRAADALLHLRDGVDRRPGRADRAVGRGRAAARLPDRLPADVRLERVRPRSRRCPTGCSRSRSGTRSAP